MRALLQRVNFARVRVEDKIVGEIQNGILVFVGVFDGDGDQEIDWMINKLLKLRVFPDEEGKMNRSVQELDGQVLLVSQFTLCADLRKGTRPSFSGAGKPEYSRELFDRLVARMRASIRVETGVFGAEMFVELENWGPVTLWLDSEK